jgi:broad specificity phosphatase PhoE
MTRQFEACTRVLLIRHGHTNAIGRRLVGRLPGIGLSVNGRAQVRELSVRLTGQQLAAVYSSPLERAVHTARALADTHSLPVICRDALTDLDFGAWTGLSFENLSGLDSWRQFNAHRATAAVPGGETALEVRARIVAALNRFRLCHENETIAVVTHLDVIRTAVLYCAGMSLDLLDRFEVSPASVTALALGDAGWRVLAVNEREEPPGPTIMGP